MTMRRRVRGFTVPIVRPGYRWGMQELVSCAISIDDVRDIFGATPELADRLRASAAARFQRPQASHRRWLRPLLRRDPELEVERDTPSAEDVSALLAGAHIPPDRVAASWRLLLGWVEELAVRSARVPWDRAAFDRLEWNLARAGLNSDYSLRRLADRDLGIPLHPMPDQVAGYAKHVHAVETRDALRAVRDHPELEPGDRQVLDPILSVLDAASADPRLDVVTIGARA